MLFVAGVTYGVVDNGLDVFAHRGDKLAQEILPGIFQAQGVQGLIGWLIQEILLARLCTVEKVLFAGGNVCSIRVASQKAVFEVVREELVQKHLGGTVAVHQGSNVGLGLEFEEDGALPL